MENINTNIKKNLLIKLDKVRHKIATDKDIYFSKTHHDMCHYLIKYKQLQNKLQIKNKTIVFKFIDDNITFLSTNVILFDSLENKKNINFLLSSKNITFTYNNFNKHFINKFQKIIDVDYIQQLIDEQNSFLKSLSIKEIYTLKYYTYFGDTIINSYISNNFKIDELKSNIFLNNTFFFQFLDYFKENPMFNSKKVPINNYRHFLDFIITNFKKFNMTIYISVFNRYILDMKRIFDKAPKNKKKFYVYRGVKDNYISKQVSHNKTRGYFTSNRFVSTSLIFDTAVNFANVLGNNKKIIYEIAIEKGVPLIFLQGISYIKAEFEILLPINSSFFIEYAVKEIYYNKDFNTICNINNNDAKNIKLTCISYFDYI